MSNDIENGMVVGAQAQWDSMAMAVMDEDDEDATPFVVDNDQKADWAMRKVLEAQQEAERWTKHYEQQLKAVKQKCADTEAYFERLLADYFGTVPHKKTKTQEKYTLPCGELILKTQAPEYVRDDETLIPFLQQNGLEEYVELKPSAKWSELKKACVLMEGGTLVEATTGMVIDGVTAEPRPPKFEVKLKKGDEQSA